MRDRTCDRDADGVEEFCKRNGFSRGMLYALWRKGEGPPFLQIGDRRFVTREAGERWRRELEATTLAARRVA
jgi:hypothetical protein